MKTIELDYAIDIAVCSYLHLNRFLSKIWGPLHYGLAPDVHPEQGELAHVLIMQHVSKELLDGFIADMKKDFGK